MMALIQTGMLWFDDDDARPLCEKVERAACYYQSKYGAWPDTCVVNACELPEPMELCVVGTTIHVELQATILPNHFWLGMAAPRERQYAAWYGDKTW